MEPIIIEAVLENPSAPVESVNAERQDEIDFYEHQKRNIQKVDHLIEEAEQSLIELKRGIYECSTVCQRNRVEVISEDSSEHCDCNDDLPTNQLIVPATPEEIDTAELFRDDFGTETNLIMPEDVEEEAEEDSHLNTISEKTEELEKSITSDLSSPVIERKERVKKLTIQQMPLISIGRPLTLQKILQIDIQPNGCTNMSDPLIRNIHYEEIKHSECKAPFKANTDVAPFALDTTIILDVTEDKKYNEFQYLSTSSGEELLDDEEKSQVTDDNEVITSAIENDVGKNISSSDIEKDEVLEVIKIPSETKAPDVIDDLSKEVTEGTGDQGITGIPLDETVDIPKEENGSEKIITTIPTDMNKPGDKKLCGCDAKGSPPPKIVNGNETITVEETTKIPSETKKSTLKELYECADDRQPRPQSKTIQPTEKQVHSMQFDSDLEASTESHLSAVSALEVLSHISEDEAATDWTHENNGQINNPVSSKEKFSDDFESSESVYVLTHDVSVQAASDGHPNLKTDTKDVESELNPKVVIRFSDPRAGRVTNNSNKASHRISNIKDKIKKKFSGESDRAILLLDSSSYDEESIYDGDINKPTDTQTVMTVNVQYSNKDVQKAIEKSPVSGVKLHRSKCCKDVDTTTSYDSDSYNYESKNLPYRNTPCGDNMSSSDYLKLYSNGRYDNEAEDFYKSTRSDSINKNQKSKILKVQDQISVTTSDSVAYKLDETLSEGEIKCKCSTSIGELHVCRYAQEIKKQSQYLRKYPEKFLKYKLNENYKHYYSHRQKIYDKCLTHATSTSTSPVDTDSNNYSSDT